MADGWVCTDPDHQHPTRSICPCVGFDAYCHSCPDPGVLPPCMAVGEPNDSLHVERGAGFIEPRAGGTAPDWDAIAAEIGLPEDWRDQGYDAPEYMERDDSVYRLTARPGSMRCPFPTCSFTTRKGTETMFRHAHGGHR